MKVLLLLCLAFLIVRAAALLTSQQQYLDGQDARRYSIHSLDCSGSRLVLVLDVRNFFVSERCCNETPTCISRPNATDFQRYFTACKNTSQCRLSVQDPERISGGSACLAQFASVNYVCSTDVPIVSESPVRKLGQALTAVHSSSGPETENSTWTCVVEAADCSTTTPVVASVYIRNSPSLPASYFSYLGGRLIDNHTETVNTSFEITLYLLQGSDVQMAYIHVEAATNVSMTCGRSAVILSEPFCDQCASSPCQEGFECVNLPGSFSCICTSMSQHAATTQMAAPTATVTLASSSQTTAPPASTWTSVSATLLPVTSQHAASTQTAASTATVTLASSSQTTAPPVSTEDVCASNPPPCDVTARCNNTEGSFHCYCDPGFLLTDNSTACVDVDECARDPPPCDVTARCNNTEGSFHCYCDPGFNLTDNSTACVVASPAEQQPQSQASVVGPAVGGVLAALVVIAVVVIVWGKRSREKQRAETLASTQETSHGDVYVNNAYEETILSENNDQQHDNAGTAFAVTSEGDTPYDVLGQKRPTAEKKRDVIYGHLRPSGSPNDDVEYSYDRAGKSPIPDVITSAIYSSAAPVSPDGEAGPEDYECSYNRLGASKSPGVITDSVYHVVEPESPAAEAEQDNGSFL